MDIWTALGLDIESHTPQLVMLGRLGLAALLGALIGFEREATERSAGLRTHILICVAACLFTLLALEIYDLALEGGSQNPDPIRAVEAVTAGIAFLGAGAIFTRRANVHGLTTGAGMWLAGAVGVATAIGLYAIAIAVAVLALIVLFLLRLVEQRLSPKMSRAADDPAPEEPPATGLR